VSSREADTRAPARRQRSPSRGDVFELGAGILGGMDASARPAAMSWLTEADRLDHAVYTAVATTPTPSLDTIMQRISRVANHSKPWIGTAALLLVSTPRARRAGTCGLAAIAATSAVANLVVKPLGRRRRPDRAAEAVPAARHVAMPGSRSFPSGHAASAMAFATAVGRVMPELGVLLRGLAIVVGYSRVHTGVHYPGDVLAGALLGAAIGDLVSAALDPVLMRRIGWA
jgi:membrane-associated phospholipid phosphatase